MVAVAEGADGSQAEIEPSQQEHGGVGWFRFVALRQIFDRDLAVLQGVFVIGRIWKTWTASYKAKPSSRCNWALCPGSQESAMIFSPTSTMDLAVGSGSIPPRTPTSAAKARE